MECQFNQHCDRVRMAGLAYTRSNIISEGGLGGWEGQMQGEGKGRREGEKCN